MPLRWLRAYQAMYPILQAEEALLSAEIAIASDSNYEQRQRQAILTRWQRQAGVLRAKPQREPMTQDEFERRMASLGMVQDG
jgi:hypothetical protein